MEKYTTQDLSLSAYLFSIGFEVLGVEAYEEKVGVYSFVFKTTEQLPVAVAMFFNGEATINPLLYYKNIKLLKTMIYDIQNDKQGGNTKRS